MMRRAHEIDYRLHGDDMQFVEIELDPGETIVAEAGAMMYMDGAIQSDTVFGDGSGRDAGKGFMDKVIGAGKRALAGESIFMTTFTNQGAGKKMVSFAAPYPGKVIPVDLADCQGQIICQRDAFLCAARGIAIEIAFQKKIGAGLFGGEGFIMQRMVGDIPDSEFELPTGAQVVDMGQILILTRHHQIKASRFHSLPIIFNSSLKTFPLAGPGVLSFAGRHNTGRFFPTLQNHVFL